MEKLWRDFGVNPNKVKKLKEFIPYDSLTIKVKESALEYVKNFTRGRGEGNNWFGLFGQAGSGKSHVILAIGAALLSMDFSVVYMPYTESMRIAKSYANDDYEYSKIMKKYTSCDVLIIDDFFKDKVRNGEIISSLKESDIRHIYPILNTRYYNNLPIVISSECTLENLVDLDEALGGRILEKCVTKIFFRGEGYDYRLKSFCKS